MGKIGIKAGVFSEHSVEWEGSAMSKAGYLTVIGESQIKSHSKISNLLHWRFKSSRQILNLISHQNLESSNSKSQIKSQIPKQQKGFSYFIFNYFILIIN